MVTDRAGDLVVQDALQPGDEFPQIASGELREAATGFEKGLLDNVGRGGAGRNASNELTFGQTVQVRSLHLEQ